MNPLLLGAGQEGPFRFLVAGLQAAAYAALTGAFGLGLHALGGAPGIRPKREQRTLQGIRAGFLLLSLALIAHSAWTALVWGEAWAFDTAKNLGLFAWLVYAGVLHLHHVPGLRGRRVILASLLGWGLVVAMNAAAAAFIE